MAMKSHTKLPKSFSDTLDRLLDRHNPFRGDGSPGVISFKYQKERAGILRLVFAELRQDGYKLEDPQNLGKRHITALAARWDKEGLAAGTLHTRISVLSVFAQWIGKEGMVKSPAHYFPADRCKRVTVAQENHAWQANGIDLGNKIGEAYELNERLGLYLELENQFGLRVKEAMEFRPRNSIHPNWKNIKVFEGTKGGRPRVIDIETDEQRRVLEKAIAMMGKDGRIRWPGLTFDQAYGRYYRLVRKLGITKKILGITSHGLRHGFAQDQYTSHTGNPTPIQGLDKTRIDRDMHLHASVAVAEALGHSRIQISTAYIGSLGRWSGAGMGSSPWEPKGANKITYSVKSSDFAALRISAAS